MIRSALRRPILFACAILAVAAAAAAMRVNQWSPVDAFLEHRTLPQSDQISLMADSRAGSPQAATQSAFGHYSPDAVAPGGFVTGTAGRTASGQASSSSFSADRLQGAASAGISQRAASLGGLWRLMGLTRAHSGGVASAAHAAKTPKAPKAPRTPHHSSTQPAPEIVIAKATTPAILIGNNPSSVSGLIAGAGGQPNAFTPGGTPHLGGGGGSLSTTPEPASILLMGTGLLGLATMLRRRRA